jgi:outer membrane protein OmpA-like peptidoglycan-associated protein
MPSVLSEVQEHAIEDKELSGPSNPMSQHAYEGFAKRQSKPGSGSGLFLGVAAIALVLVLGSILGVWLLKSVRRLNRQVAHLNRQTEQLNRRLQGAEDRVKALDQKAFQAAAEAQAAAPQMEQAKAPQLTTVAQAQPAAATPPAAENASNPAGAKAKAEEHASRREQELQSLQQSLGQIAETRRTALGLVMTLGEKSVRFEPGKSEIAPQYRGILNRIAAVLKKLNGYSFYVYGYTDENGTKDYNLTLSSRRARAVRDALVKSGVDPSLINAKGFGKSKPLVHSTNAKGRAANRRVEIGIVSFSDASAGQAISRK